MRDGSEPPEDDPDGPEQPPEPNLLPTGPGPLVVLGLIGLVAGWSVRLISLRGDHAVPTVTWLAVATTWFIGAAVAGIAFLTWRTVHRQRHRLAPEQGLARLVLGRTIARIGAFVLGGYLGSAISHLGVASESAGAVVLRTLLAALGAAGAVAAGLLLEHACRVPDGDR